MGSFSGKRFYSCSCCDLCPSRIFLPCPTELFFLSTLGEETTRGWGSRGREQEHSYGWSFEFRSRETFSCQWRIWTCTNCTEQIFPTVFPQAIPRGQASPSPCPSGVEGSSPG